MGIGMFRSTCRGGYAADAPAPNPDPKRWTLLHCYQYANGYVLSVRHHDCTNFEGVKLMVYRGRCPHELHELDPHFSEVDGSPLARFRPDDDGLRMAQTLARSL